VRKFIISAGFILAITGIAKLWNALGNAKVLGVSDPVFGISFGNLMLATGAVEVLLALICFFFKRTAVSAVLLAWVSTSFVIYRFGLWWLDWKRPCGCLGNLTEALRISPETADNITKVLLIYLLIGSYFFLGREWLSKSVRQPTPATSS